VAVSILPFNIDDRDMNELSHAALLFLSELLFSTQVFRCITAFAAVQWIMVCTVVIISYNYNYQNPLKMKKTYLSLVSTVLLIAIVGNVSGQATAYATTTAVLVTPISIAKTVDMHFGTVAASGTAGTIVLDYADGRTATGGASLPAGSTTQKTAVFTVTGEGTSGFSISVPTAAITLTGSVAGTMTVDNFVCDAGASTTLTGGTKVLKVKAILNVPASTVAGTYSNNLGNASALFVTVNYN